MEGTLLMYLQFDQIIGHFYCVRNNTKLYLSSNLKRVMWSSRYYNFNSGCSVARLARHAGGVEVGGSNPLTPTNQNPSEQLFGGIFCFLLVESSLSKEEKTKKAKMRQHFQGILIYRLPYGGSPSVRR
jgi:hypothetical protein